MVQREPNTMLERPRVTNESKPFSTTGREKKKKNESKEEKGCVIQVDTEELLDTMVKSVAGGLATGVVMNRLMDR